MEIVLFVVALIVIWELVLIEKSLRRIRELVEARFRQDVGGNSELTGNEGINLL